MQNMPKGFRKGGVLWLWCCSVWGWTVQLQLLATLPVAFSQSPMEICLENVNIADDDDNGYIDVGEFLDLIELYDSACVLDVEELSATQLNKFMQLASCPCSQFFQATSSCSCTPENSRIDVRVAYKDLDGISTTERIGLFLLCTHVSSLTDELECTGDVYTTNGPSMSPSSS